MQRLVIDTNVLIAALIRKHTPPFALYEAWRNGQFQLITSQAQLDEVERVMGYAKLQRYFTQEEARAMLSGLATYATCVDDLPLVSASPDPDDNMILATGLAGGAHYIVSGDKSDMLALGSIKGIPIISARAAVEAVG